MNFLKVNKISVLKNRNNKFENEKNRYSYNKNDLNTVLAKPDTPRRMLSSGLLFLRCDRCTLRPHIGAGAPLDEIYAAYHGYFAFDNVKCHPRSILLH